MKRRSAVGPEWMLPSSSTGEQYSSPLFSRGLKMFLKDSASVRPRTDSGRAERNAKCTPACKTDILTWANVELVVVQMRWELNTQKGRFMTLTAQDTAHGI